MNTILSIQVIDFFLLSDCLLVVGFVLIQNESAKESLANQSSSSNPIEDLTWLFFYLLFVLLLFKIKYPS